MSAPLRVATVVCRGSLLGSAAAVGLLGGQFTLAKRRIPRACTLPPVTDGTGWAAPGADRRRRPLRVLLLGDSMAAGYGVPVAEQTFAAQLALLLSASTRRPVAITNLATVGARSRDLRAQLNALGFARPADLAVVLVGANDIIHRSPQAEAVGQLVLAVHRLQTVAIPVVVATCPDLGSIPSLAEPLRSLARRRGRRLARAQAEAVLRAGAQVVALAELGPSFLREPDMFGPDRFHPSAAGYRRAAELVAPAALGSIPNLAVAYRRTA
ncbi:MAG TPA: GDSL-type esterase/lipase family protein [Jatrophihabitans sp.]|jgi:lysophospholipase L1-like esterase